MTTTHPQPHNPSLARSRLLRDFRRLCHRADVAGVAGVANQCRTTLDWLAHEVPDAQLTEPLATAYAMLLHELRAQVEVR